jgi:glutamyl/glutaminyl-tRNA synthetase
MYDWAHGQSDYIEGITHSICTLEFENHRPLYDWFLDAARRPRAAPPPDRVRAPQPHLHRDEQAQAPALVQRGHVDGWDDPRMPTIAGLRRRGYTARGHPRLLRADRRGQAATAPSTSALLEHALREDLNASTRRVMACCGPSRSSRTTPRTQVEDLTRSTTPRTPRRARARCRFSRELYIERDDFMEDAPKKFFRLAPRPRGAPPLRLPDHAASASSRTPRRGHRAALHLRPRVGAAARPRRPQGQGHHPLGQRRARHRRRGAPLRPPLRPRVPKLEPCLARG